VIIEPTTFQLTPQQSQEITLRFAAPANADPDLLPIYSGFIYVTNQVNGEVVHMSCKYSFLPFHFLLSTHIHRSIDAGVVGDYANAQIIVRKSSSGYITRIVDVNGERISDEQLSTLNATEGITIIAVTAWSTRLFFAEVVSTVDNSPPLLNSR
jgi:hypothetical protein